MVYLDFRFLGEKWRKLPSYCFSNWYPNESCRITHKHIHKVNYFGESPLPPVMSIILVFRCLISRPSRRSKQHCITWSSHPSPKRQHSWRFHIWRRLDRRRAIRTQEIISNECEAFSYQFKWSSFRSDCKPLRALPATQSPHSLSHLRRTKNRGIQSIAYHSFHSYICLSQTMSYPYCT